MFKRLWCLAAVLFMFTTSTKRFLCFYLSPVLFTVHRHLWAAMSGLVAAPTGRPLGEVMFSLSGACVARPGCSHGHDSRSLTHTDHLGWPDSTVSPVHAIASPSTCRNTRVLAVWAAARQARELEIFV